MMVLKKLVCFPIAHNLALFSAVIVAKNKVRYIVKIVKFTIVYVLTKVMIHQKRMYGYIDCWRTFKRV